MNAPASNAWCKRIFVFTFALLLIMKTEVLLAVPSAADVFSAIFGSPARGDRVSIFKNIVVDRPYNGDIVAVLADVRVESSVRGDVVSVLGDVILNGEVDGDVISVFGAVSKGPGAKVSGDVVSVEKFKNNGFGIFEKGFGNNWYSPYIRGFGLNGFSVIMLVVLLVLGTVRIIIGLIFISVAKARFISMALEIPIEFGKKFIVGFLLLIAVPFVCILSVITVIGPPLVLILTGLVLFMGNIALSIYIGRALFTILNTEMNTYLEYIAGTLLQLAVYAMICVMAPYMGITGTVVLYSLYSAFIYSTSLGITAVSQFGFVRAGIGSGKM